MVCLSRPYPFKFFKVRLPPILLGPFLKTLLHITLNQTQCEEHQNEETQQHQNEETQQHQNEEIQQHQDEGNSNIRM